MTTMKCTVREVCIRVPVYFVGEYEYIFVYLFVLVYIYFFIALYVIIDVNAPLLLCSADVSVVRNKYINNNNIYRSSTVHCLS